jgi:hypothetical protein
MTTRRVRTNPTTENTDRIAGVASEEQLKETQKRKLDAVFPSTVKCTPDWHSLAFEPDEDRCRRSFGRWHFIRTRYGRDCQGFNHAGETDSDDARSSSGSIDLFDRCFKGTQSLDESAPDPSQEYNVTAACTRGVTYLASAANSSRALSESS